MASSVCPKPLPGSGRQFPTSAAGRTSCAIWRTNSKLPSKPACRRPNSFTRPSTKPKRSDCSGGGRRVGKRRRHHRSTHAAVSAHARGTDNQRLGGVGSHSPHVFARIGIRLAQAPTSRRYCVYRGFFGNPVHDLKHLQHCAKASRETLKTTE